MDPKAVGYNSSYVLNIFPWRTGMLIVRLFRWRMSPDEPEDHEY